MIYIHQLLKERGEKDFILLVGEEIMLAECLKLSCSMGVIGGANIFPALYVRLYEAVIRGEADQVKKWQAIIQRLQQAVYHVIHSPMQFVIGIKYLVWEKGICSAQMAIPVYRELTGEQKKNIEKLVAEFDNLGL